MSGSLQLARELVILGAETLVTAPRDQLAFVEGQEPCAYAERWRSMGEQMRALQGQLDPLRDSLATDYGLGSLDCWLVALALAAERYRDVAAGLSILSEDPHMQLPSPILFAQLMHFSLQIPFAESLQVALNGGAAHAIGLVEVLDNGSGRPSTHGPLRIAPQELPKLLQPGDVGATQIAAGELQPRAARTAYPSAQIQLAAGLMADSRMLCLRCGSARSGIQLAIDVATSLDQPAHFFRATGTVPSLDVLLRIRDAMLVLDLTELGKLSHDVRLQLAETRSRLPHACLVLVAAEAEIQELPVLTVPRLGVEQARVVWQCASEDAATAKDLSSRFIVSLPEARAAVERADRTLVGAPTASRTERIARELLDDGARRIGKLATRVTSAARLADFVAPPELMSQLDEIVAWRRATHRVFGEMEVGNHTPLGRGLTALFSGPPGTGKTYAALCLANELGLNLYRIDLSQVVSKYIGETEKSLAKIFDEAEAGHGVLLFDEADALFGKRSEVKDAHDRYANIEVGYLLQRIEAFDGVAILATNLRSNMDAAFTRRLRFLMEFPMPDESMRRRLWEQALPAARFRSPDLDLDPFVKRFRLSGGCIQNIGLAGAHLAAATKEGWITPALLVRAAYRELEKTGQSRSRGSFGPLARYLPQGVE